MDSNFIVIRLESFFITIFNIFALITYFPHTLGSLTFHAYLVRLAENHQPRELLQLIF